MPCFGFCCLQHSMTFTLWRGWSVRTIPTLPLSTPAPSEITLSRYLLYLAFESHTKFVIPYYKRFAIVNKFLTNPNLLYFCIWILSRTSHSRGNVNASQQTPCPCWPLEYEDNLTHPLTLHYCFHWYITRF